jgi:hypothetical protein
MQERDREEVMRVKRILLAACLALGIGATPVLASKTTFGDGGAALQAILDQITVSPHPGVSSVDVLTDSMDDGTDSYWQITASGGSITTIITKLGAYPSASTFGVYDRGNPTLLVPLFGAAALPGDQSVLSLLADGSVRVNFTDTGIDFSSHWFGYYLDSRQPGGAGWLWYSDAALNGGEDHMVAFEGTNTDSVQTPGRAPGLWMPYQFVLAFEDLPLASSSEYGDFVLMVDSVDNLIPVPVPGAGWLALVGVGAIRVMRRRLA